MLSNRQSTENGYNSIASTLMFRPDDRTIANTYIRTEAQNHNHCTCKVIHKQMYKKDFQGWCKYVNKNLKWPFKLNVTLYMYLGLLCKDVRWSNYFLIYTDVLKFKIKHQIQSTLWSVDLSKMSLKIFFLVLFWLDCKNNSISYDVWDK